MKKIRASWLCSGTVILAQSALLMPALGQTDGLGTPALRMSHALSAMPATLTQTSINPLSFVSPSRPCAQDSVDTQQPLHLSDVLERILCRSPRMQQALASITEQHEGVILAEQAQRPRFSANADFNLSQAPATTQLSATRVRSVGAGVSLNWVLFDFGAGNASLRAARSQLAAAFAGQSSAQLAQLTDGLRLYTESLRAHARLSSLQDAEKAARLSAEIASGRYAAQVGSLAEKLQAQSALAQTQLDLTRAQGLWKTSRGNLAVAMGLPVQRNIELASVAQVLTRFDTAEFGAQSQLQATERVLETMLAEHPRILAARADIETLQARLDQVKAQNKGSISLNSGMALNQGLGGTSGREADRNLSVGVQASMPLFDSRSQNAREAQLASQISGRQAQVTTIERELQTELWQSVQQLLSEADNLKASETLLSTAMQGQEVALGRYQAGIGSVLDVLNAQNLYSQAVFQRADAGIALMQSQLRLGLNALHFDTPLKN